MKQKFILGLVLVIFVLISVSSAFAASVSLHPLYNGHYTSWQSWGASCSHASCVDETSPNTVDGVRSAGINLAKESFNFSVVPYLSGNPTVDYVMVSYYAKEYSPLYTCMRPMIRLQEADFFGSSLWCSLTPSFQTYNYVWYLNPASGGLWTVLDLMSFEAGMRAENQQRGTEAGANVSTIWVTVEYH